MRFFILLALVLLPGFAYAQSSDSENWKNRLSRLAKSVSTDDNSVQNTPTNQGQTNTLSQGLTAPSTNTIAAQSHKPAALSGKRFNQGQSRTLDIANIQIGMSAKQVSNILTAAGYSPDSSMTRHGPSFDELVEIARKGLAYPETSQFKAGITKLEFKKTHEIITIDFLNVPGGEITYKVKYGNKNAAITSDKAAHLLRDKYGPDFYSNSRRERRKYAISLGQTPRDLPPQAKFTWLNRLKGKGGGSTQKADDNGQQLDGSIGRGFGLTLRGERLWKDYQKEAVRDQLAPPETTF